MAQHNNNIGALGGLSRGDYNTIEQGLQSKNDVIASPFGMDITPTNVMTTAIGLAAAPLSTPIAVGGLIGDYNLNKASNTALGRNNDFMNNINRTSFNDIRGQVDINKDGRVDTREAQNWGMNKGLSAYDVNLNPMQGYTPGTVTTSNLGKIDPAGGYVGGYENKAYTPNSYTQNQVNNISRGIGKGVGSTGNLGSGFFGRGNSAGYKGSVGNVFGFGKAEGVNEAGPTGLGKSEQTAEQVTVDPTKGKDLSRTFADDQASSSDSGGTYICTALYEMGDMKKSIYKYDQIYGKKVDPATYRGYELWGKYVASKLRNRGIVYKVAKPIALTWANQMAYDLSKGKIGKNSLAIKITKTIGEGCCYVLGQIFKRRQLWLKST